jgi:hypothetical protein
VLSNARQEGSCRVDAGDQVDRDEHIGRRRKSATGSINDATHAKLSSNTSLGSVQYLLARAQKINRGVKGRLQSWSIGLGRSRPSAAVDRCHPLRVTIRCSSTWQSLLRKVPQLKGRMRG